MSLKSALQLLHQIAVKEDTSMPLIVGGAVRDRVIGNKKNAFNDIDITTGDDSVFHLAKEFSIKLKKQIPLFTKEGTDGHISVFLPEIKIDFSSNFNVPGIEQILNAKGIVNPTPMQKEIYSRDFFCNTLLMSLDFRKVKDVSGEGVKDIKKKIIRTCLMPDLTFKYNVKRIIRVIYLAAKLDFDVEPEILEWIKRNPRYITQCDAGYLSKNIDNALKYNADKTIWLINQMNLWNYLPITPALYPHFYKRNVGTIT